MDDIQNEANLIYWSVEYFEKGASIRRQHMNDVIQEEYRNTQQANTHTTQLDSWERQFIAREQEFINEQKK